MKKRDFALACRLRCNTKIFLKEKRLLKKLRNKRARRSKNPELIYKSSNAWDII